MKKIYAYAPLIFMVGYVLALYGRWIPSSKPVLYVGIAICLGMMVMSFGFCRYCDEWQCVKH